MFLCNENIFAYAPTTTNPYEIKDKFYEYLNTVIGATPGSDKLIILRNYNARVECDSGAWEGVIGKHGVGKCNSNGLLLLQTSFEHSLLIKKNTIFGFPVHN